MKSFDFLKGIVWSNEAMFNEHYEVSRVSTQATFWAFCRRKMGGMAVSNYSRCVSEFAAALRMLMNLPLICC